MPDKEALPECPVGVAIAKPKRDTWLVEELLDTLFVEDTGGKVVPTRFPGVFLLYSRLDPVRVIPLFRRHEHSFLQRFVPAQVCLSRAREGDPTAVVRRLAELLASRGVDTVRLIINLRGEGKKLASRREVEAAVALEGIRVSRKEHVKHAIAVESIDNLLVAAAGITRGCGLSCILIDFTGLRLT